MEITFLTVPALVMILLSTKSVKTETSLGIARILSLLSFLIIIIYGVFVCLGVIVPALQEEPVDHGFVDVISIFLIFFAIEAALHFLIFLMASKSLA